MGESAGWEGRDTKPVWPGPHGPRCSSNTWLRCCNVAVSRVRVLWPDSTKSPAGRGANKRGSIYSKTYNPRVHPLPLTDLFSLTDLFDPNRIKLHHSSSLKSLQRLSSIFQNVLTFPPGRLLHYKTPTFLNFPSPSAQRAWPIHSAGNSTGSPSFLIFWHTPFHSAQLKTHFLQEAFSACTIAELFTITTSLNMRANEKLYLYFFVSLFKEHVHLQKLSNNTKVHVKKVTII